MTPNGDTDAMTPNGGTPRAIGPIAEEVLCWVASQRGTPELRRPTPDELRRIELCAQAAREAAMFHDLYGQLKPTGHLDFIGGDPHATAP